MLFCTTFVALLPILAMTDGSMLGSEENDLPYEGGFRLLFDPLEAREALLLARLLVRMVRGVRRGVALPLALEEGCVREVLYMLLSILRRFSMPKEVGQYQKVGRVKFRTCNDTLVLVQRSEEDSLEFLATFHFVQGAGWVFPVLNHSSQECRQKRIAGLSSHDDGIVGKWDPICLRPCRQ